MRAALAYVAYFVAVGVQFPYLPVWYQSLGLPLGTIGLLAAIAAAVGLLAAPAWGMLADRGDGRGRALPTAALLAAVAAIGLWLAGRLAVGDGVPGAPGAVGGRAAVGAGLTGAVPLGAFGLLVAAAIAVAATSNGVGPQLDARSVASLGGDRARYGRLRAWGSLSFIVTAALAGRLLDVTGPGGLFLVYVPALLATAAITQLVGPRPIRPEGAVAPAVVRPRRVAILPFGPGIRELLAAPELRAYLLAAFVGWSALNATNSFLSVDLVALGASPALVGIAWAVSAGLEVPLMWAFPRLAARFGTEPLLVLGPIVIGVRSLACALAPSPEALVAASALQGVGFAFSFVGGVAHVARLAPRHLGATAQGVFGGATVGLGAIVGSGTAGALVGTLGLPGVFAASAVASVLAAALVIRSLRIGARAGRYDDGAMEARWISG